MINTKSLEWTSCDNYTLMWAMYKGCSCYTTKIKGLSDDSDEITVDVRGLGNFSYEKSEYKKDPQVFAKKIQAVVERKHKIQTFLKSIE